MATSGSTSVTVTSYDTLKFNWWRNSYNVAGNYTDIGWNMQLISTAYGLISSSVAKSWSVNVNGTVYSGNNYVNIGNNATKTLASGTTRIYHNTDGTKSFNYSFSQQFNMNFNGWVGTKSGSGSATLDTIPRYLKINTFNTSSGLTSINVSWATDVARDYTQYSLNGGAWKDAGDSVASDNKSGNFTIGGLSPNTTYTIKIRLKRKDSQLWTESSSKSVATKDIARITSAPSINFGDTARIIKTNPSGAKNNIRVETLNPTTTIATRENVGNDITITFNDTEWDKLYKKLGTANSTTIRYVVDTYSGSTYWCQWVDKTLTLRGNQKTTRTKVSGTWRRGKLWTKVNGSWKRAVIWTKINGTWRRGI